MASTYRLQNDMRVALYPLLAFSVLGIGDVNAQSPRYYLGNAGSFEELYRKPAIVFDGRAPALGQAFRSDQSASLSVEKPALGILAGTRYLPPLGYVGAAAFYENLRLLDRLIENDSVAARSAPAGVMYPIGVTVLSSWVGLVQGAGPWDYKRVYDALGGKNPAMRLLLENFGNFNYEATGRYLGLSRGQLALGAGVVSQKNLHIGVYGGLLSSFGGDDPVDWIYRRLGQTYFDSGQYIRDYFIVMQIHGEADLTLRSLMVLEFERNRLTPYQYLEEQLQAERINILNTLSVDELTDQSEREIREKAASNWFFGEGPIDPIDRSR
ncbi:hypothetical protein HFN86_09100 [Rhizobium laguerreae]|uniref:hypothetical protein n=1 Tax=Rhizobium laguerreae TaxID=1076926 RepID=UPI001C904E56|nr:hypothetical protein [Rhizobium laguerreae]MBY3420367.1 hypothetical protein [Rhizobium laguerreae]